MTLMATASRVFSLQMRVTGGYWSTTNFFPPTMGAKFGKGRIFLTERSFSNLISLGIIMTGNCRLGRFSLWTALLRSIRSVLSRRTILIVKSFFSFYIRSNRREYYVSEFVIQERYPEHQKPERYKQDSFRYCRQVGGIVEEQFNERCAEQDERSDAQVFFGFCDTDYDNG